MSDDQHCQEQFERQQQRESAGQGIGQRLAVGPDQRNTGAIQEQRDPVNDPARLLSEQSGHLSSQILRKLTTDRGQNEHLKEQGTNKGHCHQQM